VRLPGTFLAIAFSREQDWNFKKMAHETIFYSTVFFRRHNAATFEIRYTQTDKQTDSKRTTTYLTLLRMRAEG